MGDNSLPTIDVPEAFTGGGSEMGLSFTRDRSWELQNYTSWTRGRHNLKMGAQVYGQRLTDSSTRNFAGTFTFAGGFAPQLDERDQVVTDPDGVPIRVPITTLDRYRRTLLFQEMGLDPDEIRRLGGGAAQLSIAGGNPEVSVDQYTAGLFFQDDWTLRPNFHLNLGLRYERQNNIRSNLDLAPRLGFAWSPGSAKGKPGIVIRGGFGIFYQRFGSNLTLRSTRFNGTNQQQFFISDH